jgi:predicted PurR-regulated permease PerM
VTTGAPVPRALQAAAGWSWRLLAVASLLATAGFTFWILRGVAIPLFVSVLVATQLLPVARWLERHGAPRWLAVLVVMLGLIAALAFLTIVIVGSLISQLGQIGHLVSEAADQVTAWLAKHQGPLHLSGPKVTALGHQAGPALASVGGALFGGVISGASLFAELVGGTAMALAFLIYVLSDGEQVGSWLVTQADPERGSGAGRLAARAWGTLGAYVRGVTTVAAFDAVFIGAGLVLLDVPIAGSLTAMVFLAAFVPIAGAWVSGAVCVAVALAGNGTATAVAVLAVVLVVQEVESVVLDPMIYRREVNLHPIATLGAVTVGGILAGIIGSLIAVPLTALAWAVVSEARAMARPAQTTASSVTPPG